MIKVCVNTFSVILTHDFVVNTIFYGCHNLIYI